MMAKDSAMSRLVALLAKAQQAHHETFREEDGYDPEWPLWYAEFLLADLRAELSAEFTQSELVYLLLTAGYQQSIEAPGMSWSEFVARFLVRRYLAR
jgi:hypothetical protein